MTARILIIEDEALVAMELRFVLEDLGYEVVGTAPDARTARALASRGGVELALVDIHLTDGATGVGLGQELGEDFGVTVLYMTANPGMVSHGIPGTMGVLTKPTDEGCVRSAVEYALHLRRGEPAPVVPDGLQMFG
jgi:DNA-binding NarL/FixJ family response regulator